MFNAQNGQVTKRNNKNYVISKYFKSGVIINQKKFQDDDFLWLNSKLVIPE